MLSHHSIKLSTLTLTLISVYLTLKFEHFNTLESLPSHVFSV